MLAPVLSLWEKVNDTVTFQTNDLVPIKLSHASLILSLCALQQYLEICVLFLQILYDFKRWPLRELCFQLHKLGL